MCVCLYRTNSFSFLFFSFSVSLVRFPPFHFKLFLYIITLPHARSSRSLHLNSYIYSLSTLFLVFPFLLHNVFFVSALFFLSLLFVVLLLLQLQLVLYLAYPLMMVICRALCLFRLFYLSLLSLSRFLSLPSIIYFFPYFPAVALVRSF